MLGKTISYLHTEKLMGHAGREVVEGLIPTLVSPLFIEDGKAYISIHVCLHREGHSHGGNRK